jgi:uncharacterized repeat protein (TIGR01451 family)
MLIISAVVTSPTPPANKAMMTHADQFDPNTLNNAASVTVHPQQADLRLTSTVNKPRPNVGDAITLTITLSDAGPSAATNVEVDDFLPAGITFDSATASQGSYNNGTGVWTIGSVAYLASKRLVIQGTVVSPNTQVNTASILHADQFDPKTSSNTASTTAQPLQANLALAQFISDPSPSVNDTVLYTITVTNAGPDAATGVKVSEFLPAGLTLVSASASRGSYSSGTGTWTIGSLRRHGGDTRATRQGGVIRYPLEHGVDLERGSVRPRREQQQRNRHDHGLDSPTNASPSHACVRRRGRRSDRRDLGRDVAPRLLRLARTQADRLIRVPVAGALRRAEDPGRECPR